MDDTDCTSVAIVGAGPVGLAMAAELARQHVACRVVEKKVAPSKHSKALAIFPRTLELFQRLGLAESLLEAGHRLQGLSVHAGESRIAHVTFQHLDTPYQFVLVLPQSRTEEILIEHLKRQGIAIQWQREVVGLEQRESEVRLDLQSAAGERYPLSADWLVACDGAHSFVRHQLDLAFLGQRCQERFLLADVKLRGELSNSELHSFFHQEGALAFIPIDNENWRVIVTDIPGDDDESAEPPRVSEVQEFVDRRGPGEIRLLEAHWISRFHIARRQVADWRAGRVLLAGDAAHVCSPAGGQGMNLGIQDAANLAWKIKLVHAGRAEERLIDTYCQERQAVASDTLALTDRLTRLVTLENSFLQSARNLLLSLLSRIPGLKERLAKSLSELAINYRRGPLTHDDWSRQAAGRGHAPRAGDRAPDGLLQTCSGTGIRLFELLRDPRHILLLFEGKARERARNGEHLAMREMIRREFDDVVAVYDILASASTDSSFSPETYLFDSSSVHKHYGAQHSSCFLIRPDGYISYRGCPPTAQGLRRHLNTIFLSQKVHQPRATS